MQKQLPPLRIKILEGKGLDKVSKPFICLGLLGTAKPQWKKTAVCELNTKIDNSARWNEEFTFLPLDPKDSLIIQLKNHHAITSDKIKGEIEISPISYLNQPPNTAWRPLRKHKGSMWKQTKIELLITVEWCNNAALPLVSSGALMAGIQPAHHPLAPIPPQQPQQQQRQQPPPYPATMPNMVHPLPLPQPPAPPATAPIPHFSFGAPLPAAGLAQSQSQPQIQIHQPQQPPPLPPKTHHQQISEESLPPIPPSMLNASVMYPNLNSSNPNPVIPGVLPPTYEDATGSVKNGQSNLGLSTSAKQQARPRSQSAIRTSRTQEEYGIGFDYDNRSLRGKSNASPPSAPPPSMNPEFVAEQQRLKQNHIEQVPTDQSELALLSDWFNIVDQDKSGEIDENELSAALRAGGEKFSLRAVKAMISLFDGNDNGKIDLKEFGLLFRFIRNHRFVFEQHANQSTQILAKFNLHNALRASGLNNLGPQYQSVLKNPNITGFTFEEYLDLLLLLTASYFKK